MPLVFTESMDLTYLAQMDYQLTPSRSFSLRTLIWMTAKSRADFAVSSTFSIRIQAGHVNGVRGLSRASLSSCCSSTILLLLLG